MYAQILATIQCDHQANCKQTARVQWKTRPSPDLSPGVTCDQILEIDIQLGLGGFSAFNVLVAQYASSDTHSGFMAFSFIHGLLLVRKDLQQLIINGSKQSGHMKLIVETSPPYRAAAARERTGGNSKGRVRDMDVKSHWEKVYSEKATNAVSWYAPHLDASLELIEESHAGRSAALIDVGGGESTLVDDLLERGYENITVLDVSQTAIDVSRRRLGELASRVRWLMADVIKAELKPGAYDVWHDRAVFHFLTAANDRAAYVQQVRKAIKAGSHVIVSTFGPEGPMKCSGLDVLRYDAESLRKEFGEGFRLLRSFTTRHKTPWGATQQFLHCHFRFEALGSRQESA